MEKKLEQLQEIQELLARAWYLAHELGEGGDYSSPVYWMRNHIAVAEDKCIEARDYLKEEN